MPSVLANGLSFNTCELGSGPPVVMLHGLLVGNLAMWYFTGARALARSHRVLLYDLRGHGRSERATSGYTAPVMCDDLEALLAGFTDEPVSLVGHSFGALIALEYTLRHPERVRKLVLVEAPVPPTTTADLTSFLSLGPDEMVEALPDALRRSVAGGGRRGNRLLASLRFLAYETSLLQDLATAYPVTDEQLADMSTPTLVVCGDSSACRVAGDRLGGHIPGAELVILQGGHYLPVDAPTALSASIRAFLDG